MKIKSISIKNYKGFENFSAEFHDELTVIVGDNGAGKSSLLDAVSIAAGTFLTDFNQGTSISKEDALLKSFDMGSVIDLQPQFPVIISAKGSVDQQPISWRRELNSANGRTTITNAREMTQLSSEYSKAVMEGDTNKILPVLSYYGTGRLWAQKKEKRDGNLVRFTRQMGYTDCLAAESNEKLMKKWFEKMTIQGSQNGGISPELSAVQQAVSMCFEGITGYSDIKTFFNLDTHSLDIQYTDPTGKRMRYPTEALSDGYKNTLSMIADIAYRMAVLNPFLLGDVLVETPGLVLIDEIDLHLHPLWQQRILNDLRRIFPKVQFIVTTHAPSVIHSVKKENLLILSDNTTAYPPVCEIYGSDANEILESVMGARKRPPEIQEMFNNFYNAMDSDNYIHAREILKAIEMLIGSNDSEYVSAAVSLDLAEL